jgi:hypothetical protein
MTPTGGICWSRAARRSKRTHLARPRALSGCDPQGGARAVPGRGFADCVRAVRKLARPANAGLPGAGCPGSGSIVRYHEARDRTEPRPRGFGKSRGRAPEGERVSQKGARTAIKRKRKRLSAWVAPARPLPVRLSALRLPLLGAKLSCGSLSNPRGANKSAARERWCSSLRASGPARSRAVR